MKKRLIALTMLAAIAISAVACGTKEASQNQEIDPGNNESAVNPWRDCTEDEAYQYAPNGFSAPEAATNVRWSLMEAGDDNTLPGTMVQMSFDLDGVAMNARQQAVAGEEIVDISGMYYDWTASDEGTLNNWGEGHMPYKSYRYKGDDGCVDVICWFDIELGYAYSLSAQATDLDGFDIVAVAEQMYDPEKQVGAHIPDDSTSVELDEYSNNSINGYSEDAAPSIDISGCDTFTQIVDSKLTKGMGYANVSLLNDDVLLVSSGTFDDMEFGINAIDAAVFAYDKDGVPCELGKICSAGTAYPITVKDGYLYTGSNHWICKWAVADGKISIMEKAAVLYDSEGNGTYYYESEDGGDYSSMDSAEAEKIFDDLVGEMMDGEKVVFDTVDK